jgi:hypothetical protein
MPATPMKPELRYTPQSSPSVGVNSLLDEAWRLGPFTPPFTFSAFFSPEDTLLCVCAADVARQLVAEPARTFCSADPGFRIAELTSGSGLIGLYLLGRDCNATLLGLDIDGEAKQVAEQNAVRLGLSDRARFAQSDLWSPSTLRRLNIERPQMIVCNPPYVPEPPGTTMEIEAGAGPHGTAHLMRALELTRVVQPDALALSWCSLSDPAGIVAAAEASGYRLHTLFVTAIADGEYSGSVHSYLRGLDDSFINEQSETLDIVAPDPSARFAYLLFAGAFLREAGSGTREAGDGTGEAGVPSGNLRAGASAAVRQICADFARDGVRTLASANAPFSLRCSILNRWDELKLRVILHGEVARTVSSRFPPPASRVSAPA